MAVTLFPDGVPCVLQEAFDLSFLRRWGRVFRVFDQQDSGNLCFGLEREGRRYFLKFAGARPVRYPGEPADAVRWLERSAQVYRDLAHPVLLPLLWAGPVAGGYAVLSPAYHKMPFANPVGRMWGSTRFMAPEEFQKGAAIDERTMVYTMGALAFELFAPAGRTFSDWPLSQSAWECAKKAISPQREERYADLISFWHAWREAVHSIAF